MCIDNFIAILASKSYILLVMSIDYLEHLWVGKFFR